MQCAVTSATDFSCSSLDLALRKLQITVFMSMVAFNENSIKCLVSFVEWINIVRCYHSSNDLMTSQETKRQSIVMISFSFCEKFLNISVREQHTRARLQLRNASFAFNPLVPWFETNQERNIRTAHQKVFQMGSINFHTCHRPYAIKFLSYHCEILSFHRIRRMNPTAFPGCPKIRSRGMNF